jgi:hypothetical protein
MRPCTPPVCKEEGKSSPKAVWSEKEQMLCPEDASCHTYLNAECAQPDLQGKEKTNKKGKEGYETPI